MAEEKVVKINLSRRLKNIPKWKRNAAFVRLLKEKVKSGELKISQKFNEKIWSQKTSKIRLKLVKDDKTVKAEVVE